MSVEVDPRDVVVNSLLLEGQTIKAEIASSITSAKLKRTIDGAPTLSIDIHDPHRTLVGSGFFAQRLTAQLDDRSFELTQLGKKGSILSVTLEDLAIAEMRRHKDPLKVEGGTMTRVEFGRRLLQETPWIKLFVHPSVHEETAKVALARGIVASSTAANSGVNPNYFGAAASGGATAATTPKLTKSQQNAASQAAILGTAEDTWTCLKRIFNDVNWRCYVDTGAVYVGPDSAFLSSPIEVRLRETDEGVDNIDYDFDLGKATATATLTVRAHRWQLPPGTAVELIDTGLPNPWLVSSIDRDLFSFTSTLTLKKPEPELPEPDPPADPTDAIDGSYFGDLGGLPANLVGSGSGEYIWPITGAHKINSPFGTRNGRLHAGIDIDCRDGTPVYCSRAGTVTFAGSQSGYGNVVYVSHGGGDETRYGHLSQIAVRRGLQVAQGALLGLSGHTGDATGPHLHFEIRRNGQAIDPLPLLSNAAQYKPTVKKATSGGGAGGGGGGVGAS